MVSAKLSQNAVLREMVCTHPQVRTQAQEALGKCVHSFQGSHRLLMKGVVHMLTAKEGVIHEQLKVLAASSLALLVARLGSSLVAYIFSRLLGPHACGDFKKNYR